MTIDTQKLALQALAGHGHVRPRTDGVRMRCGGPAICRVCQQEKAQLEMSQRMEQAFHPLDGQHINQGSADAAAAAYEREYLRDLLGGSLGRAYSLGQTYWMQADSESYSQNRRADETQAKFDAMRTDTAAKFESLLDHIDAQEAEIAQARQTADYWKAEHNAANAEVARLREALRWYSAKAKQMGGAAIRSDSKGMLALMHEIAADDGRRGRAALSGEGK